MSSAIEGGYYTADARNLFTPDQARMQDWTMAGGTFVPTSTSSYTFSAAKSISPTPMDGYMAENVSYGFGIGKVGGTGTVTLLVEIYNSVSNAVVATGTTQRTSNGRLFVTVKTPDTAPTQMDYLKARVTVTSDAAGIVVQEPTFTLGTTDLGPLPPLFTLYIGQFAIRVVLYTPNGPWQRVLTAANNIEVSFPLSDVGALKFNYNKTLPEWKLLAAKHCEVAVEFSVNGFNWTEPWGGRFYRMSMADDDAEPVGETKFTFVSWGWFMRRISMLVDPVVHEDDKGFLVLKDQREHDAGGAQESLRIVASRIGGWSSKITISWTGGATANTFNLYVAFDKVGVESYVNFSSFEALIADVAARSNFIRVENLHSSSTYPANIPARAENASLSAGSEDRVFAGVTPGAMLKAVIDEEHARGVMTGLTYDFTATVDSDGRSWSTGVDLVTISYAPGATLFDILSDLVDENYVNWTTDGRTLKVFNTVSTTVSGVSQPEGRLGRDLSAAVIYRLGYEITTAPNTGANEDLLTRAVVYSDGNYSVTVRTNDEATPYGHFSKALTQSGSTDINVMNLIGNNIIVHGANIKRQMTRSIDWKNTSRLPFEHFSVGDYIGLVTDSPYPDIATTDVQRVMQITLQVSEKEGLTGNLVLNTRLEDTLVRYARHTNKVIAGLRKT